MRPARLPLAPLLVALLCLLATSGVAIGGYSIAAPGSIDTPTHTVTLKSNEYTVSSIAQVKQGETLQLTTSAPSGTPYRVYLYARQNGVNKIIAQRYVGTGDTGTVTFDTNGYDPGSYIATIYADGHYQVIQPVVVAGYDLTLSAPDSAPTGSLLGVTVSVQPTAASGSPARVEVVLTGASVTKRVNATKSNGQYSARIALNTVPTGTYHVYTVARSSNKGPDGRQEIIAVATPQSLTVTTAKQTTSSSTGSADTGTSGTITTPTTATTATATTTTTAPTTTPTPPSTSTPHTTMTDGSTSTVSTHTPTSTSNAGAIQPNLSATTTTSSPDTAPVLLAVLVSLGVIALIVRERLDY